MLSCTNEDMAKHVVNFLWLLRQNWLVMIRGSLFTFHQSAKYGLYSGATMCGFGTNTPKESLFVLRVKAPCVSWGSQSWCLARKKHGHAAIFTVSMIILRMQRQSGNGGMTVWARLRWCDLSSTSGGRRRSREAEVGSCHGGPAAICWKKVNFG